MVMCILGQEYWVCLMLLDCGNFKLSFACCVIFVDSKWFCTFSYCASFKYRMTYADRCERAVGSMGYSFCCSSLCCAFCSLLKGQCVFQGVRDPLIFVQFFIFGSLLHCSFFVLVFISCGREYVGFGVCLFCLFVYYVVFSADLVLYVIFLPSVMFYGCERPTWFCCFLFVFPCIAFIPW